MLYFVLILAAVFYTLIFVLWGAVEPHVQSAAPTLSAWQQIVVSVPNHAPLVLLKELIIVTAAYLLFDSCRVAVIKGLRSWKMRNPRPEPYSLSATQDL